MARSPDDRPTWVNQQALEAIVSAHYSQVLAAPATARTRAQTAYTIASAAAAGLVTAGVLSNIRSFPTVVQVLGALALSAWVGAAALFIRVAGEATGQRSSSAPLAQPATASAPSLLTGEEFVIKALARAADEARAIDARLTDAIRVSWWALALTVIAFVAALLWPARGTALHSTLVLSREGRSLLASVCDRLPTVIEGSLRTDTLVEKFAIIKLAAGRCRERAVVVRIPPTTIQTLVSSE